MTSVPLLTAAMLICAASAFAQEQLCSKIHPNRSAEPDKSVQAPASKPWNIVPSQPPDVEAGKNSLRLPQIDAYKIDPSRMENGQSFRWGSQIDPMTVMSYGEPGDDTVCLKIRSYVVARDDRDSDSVHLVGYSTCQPASRYRLRTTQIQTDPSGR
jgi:hypothetical protein